MCGPLSDVKTFFWLCCVKAFLPGPWQESNLNFKQQIVGKDNKDKQEH